PPAELEVQLAWAMLASVQHLDGVDAFIAAMGERTDLTERDRAALHEIQTIRSLRRADQAMTIQDPERAVAILKDARRETHHSEQIDAALASVYVRQGDYENAVQAYREWGMKGAKPGDYLSAAGAALASDQSIVAEQFLWEGRQRWPGDPDLLHMAARQD